MLQFDFHASCSQENEWTGAQMRSSGKLRTALTPWASGIIAPPIGRDLVAFAVAITCPTPTDPRGEDSLRDLRALAGTSAARAGC